MAFDPEKLQQDLDRRFQEEQQKRQGEEAPAGNIEKPLVLPSDEEVSRGFAAINTEMRRTEEEQYLAMQMLLSDIDNAQPTLDYYTGNGLAESMPLDGKEGVIAFLEDKAKENETKGIIVDFDIKSTVDMIASTFGRKDAPTGQSTLHEFKDYLKRKAEAARIMVEPRPDQEQE